MTDPASNYNTIPEALEAFASGKFVIVADNEDRENEGDLILAAEFANAENIAFLLRHSSGIVCVPLKEDRLSDLNLTQMVEKNSDNYGTAFTVTVDLKEGITTGVSAADRAATIRALANEKTLASDLTRPGHIFPLQARAGGTLMRAGHTEAAIDLAELSGCFPASVICEMMLPDGEMMRTPDLVSFSNEHGIPFITIDQLIKYRRSREQLVERVATDVVETRYGELTAIQYICPIDKSRHMAFLNGEITENEPVTVRVHRSKGVLDMIGYQSNLVVNSFDLSMSALFKSPPSILVVLAEDKNYGDLQSAFPTDIEVIKHRRSRLQRDDGAWREIGIGAQIIRDLGARKLNIIASHRHTYSGLNSFGLEVVSQEPLEVYLSDTDHLSPDVVQ